MADTDTPVIDQPDADISTALDIRRPDVPVTLNDLAAMKSDAEAIIQARVTVLETLRKAALRMTSPEDWLLFKAPDDAGGQIVGYLQDAGCERIRDLSGIEIFNVSRPQKILAGNPREFHYIVSGCGRRKLTGQTIEGVEGGRSSTDDFCKDKEGVDLDLAVRKAARANLDGRIVRDLAGMSNVPVQELEEAWTGTNKKIANCRRGRGFGTRNERLGANVEKAPDVEPPICKFCNAKMVYRPGKNDRGAFYGCPNYQKHPDQKFTVDAAKWIEQQPAKPAAPESKTEPSPADASPSGAQPPAQAQGMFSDKDVPFGGSKRK